MQVAFAESDPKRESLPCKLDQHLFGAAGVPPDRGRGVAPPVAGHARHARPDAGFARNPSIFNFQFSICNNLNRREGTGHFPHAYAKSSKIL